MDDMRYLIRILVSLGEVHLIDDVCWAEAKQAIKNEYCEAASWEICRGIIQNFEQLYPCKYRSDWETYLFESKLEDFYAVRGEIFQLRFKQIRLNRSWKISMPFGEKLSLFLRFTRQKGKSLIMSFCF